jgi:uncharacterized protein
MGIFYVILAILIFAFVILILYMFFEAHKNRITFHQLSFPEFPVSFDQWTIFFISDIHRRNISEKIIENAKGKADIVIIGGDLAEKGVKLGKVKENLLKLKQIAPIYFVWGNNDYELEEAAFRGLLLEMGIKILENCTCHFQTAKGDKLALMGLDFMSTDEDHLDLVLQEAGDTPFRILVSHDPNISDIITPEQNIHLVLSGHTHGGQIRIFGYGPYEKGGLKKNGSMILFVSNGYGTTALPFRLGAKAETHLITLTNPTTSSSENSLLLK